MIRVVLDTNILISALLSPQGPPAQVFLMAILEPDMQLCASGEIFAEYEEVIRRPRFNRSASEIEGTLRAIRNKALWVKPTAKVRASSDPDDKCFSRVRTGGRGALSGHRQCEAFSCNMGRHADRNRSPVPR